MQQNKRSKILSKKNKAHCKSNHSQRPRPHLDRQESPWKKPLPSPIVTPVTVREERNSVFYMGKKGNTHYTWYVSQKSHCSTTQRSSAAVSAGRWLQSIHILVNICEGTRFKESTTRQVREIKVHQRCTMHAHDHTPHLASKYCWVMPSPQRMWRNNVNALYFDYVCLATLRCTNISGTGIGDCAHLLMSTSSLCIACVRYISFVDHCAWIQYAENDCTQVKKIYIHIYIYCTPPKRCNV